MSKESLIEEMKNFLDETKWHNSVQEVIQDLLQYYPSNPWTYLIEKQQIKQQSKIKGDNQRTFAIQDIGHLLLNCQLTDRQQFQETISQILVVNHQITKIKRNDTLKIVTIALIEQSKDNKDQIIKYLNDTLDDNINIGTLVIVLYKTLILRDLLQIYEDLLKQFKTIDFQTLLMILNEYIHTYQIQVSTETMDEGVEKIKGYKSLNGQQITQCLCEIILK